MRVYLNDALQCEAPEYLDQPETEPYPSEADAAWWAAQTAETGDDGAEAGAAWTDDEEAAVNRLPTRRLFYFGEHSWADYEEHELAELGIARR